MKQHTFVSSQLWKPEACHLNTGNPGFSQGLLMCRWPPPSRGPTTFPGSHLWRPHLVVPRRPHTALPLVPSPGHFALTRSSYRALPLSSRGPLTLSFLCGPHAVLTPRPHVVVPPRPHGLPAAPHPVIPPRPHPVLLLRPHPVVPPSPDLPPQPHLSSCCAPTWSSQGPLTLSSLWCPHAVPPTATTPHLALPLCLHITGLFVNPFLPLTGMPVSVD